MPSVDVSCTVCYSNVLVLKKPAACWQGLSKAVIQGHTDFKCKIKLPPDVVQQACAQVNPSVGCEILALTFLSKLSVKNICQKHDYYIISPNLRAGIRHTITRARCGFGLYPYWPQ